MTRLIILLIFSPLLCMGQKIDVDFDAYLYRHADSCRYERVTWGTIAKQSRKEQALFVMVIDQDTLELDLYKQIQYNNRAILQGDIPDTQAGYTVKLDIYRRRLQVTVIDDEDRVMHVLYSQPCCRKK